MVTNLQLLRFLAALDILVLHSLADLCGDGQHAGIIDWFSAIGGSGVDIFFVISGFVIQRSIEIRPRSFSAFAWARLCRIAPIYWLATSLMCVLILTLSLVGSERNAKPPSWAEVLTSFTFTSQLIMGTHPIVRPGWSLEFEVAFYLTFSLVLTVSRRLRLFVLGVLFFVTAVLSGNFFVLEFVLGVLIAKLPPTQAPRWNIALVSTGVALIGSSCLWPDVDNFLKWGIPAALIVTGLALTKQIKGSLWLLLGRLSYPLYVFHILIISVLKWPFVNFALLRNQTWVALLIYGAVSIFVAYLVDRYVDKPAQRLLHKLQHRLQK